MIVFNLGMHRILAATICFAVCAVCLGTNWHLEAASSSLASLASRQQEKLKEAVERLNRQRESIQSESAPMTRAWNELQEELLGLREQARTVQAVRDSKSVSLDRLESQLADQKREFDYISRAVAGEFVASFESSLSVGELGVEGEAIRAHNLLLDAESSDSADSSIGQGSLESSLRLMDSAIGRIESLIGGRVYQGQALGESSRMISGSFLQVGPLLYFSDDSGARGGWVDESRSLSPLVRELNADQVKAISAITRDGKGTLPIDPSLGDAIAIQTTEDSLFEHLERGGIWVYPIVLFALIATVVGCFKFAQIFTIRQPNQLVVHDIVKLLRNGEKASARSLAEGLPEPSSALLIAGIDHADESIELVEEVLYESMLSVQPKLERFLNVIAVTAATAPLLGLLGTVTGIIKTFKLMEVFGAGDPKPLISGISEALITTELGLVLAIPALLLHALLARKVAGVLNRLEKLSMTFVNGLSRRSPAAGPLVGEGEGHG